MSETHVGAAPLKVLVVDDDLLIQMATSDMIAEMGHAVLGAASAQEALDRVLEGEGVDLVITDHAMPGMTGLELARKLRESRPDLPVMLATGFDEIPGNEPGDEWPRLRKPFQPDELAALMGRLCGA